MTSPDGWFHTGDIGWIDAKGYLHVLGRADEIIIVGSSNVCPGDLEAVLDGCAEITEAAELGEVPAACVVPRSGRKLSREQVIGLYPPSPRAAAELPEGAAEVSGVERASRPATSDDHPASRARPRHGAG